MHVATLIELRIGCQAGALSSLEVAIDGLLDVSAAAVRAVALQRIPLVVMLNKSDLFDARIESGASKFYKYFPRCGKKVARKPVNARTWLCKELEKPAAKNKYLTSPHGQVSCFATCAIHTNQAQFMVERVMGAIMTGAVSTFKMGLDEED